MAHDLLILGDFGAREHAGRKATEPFARRDVLHVDRDDLDTVIARFSPELNIVIDPDSPPVAITFSALDDFHPDKLAERVPLLRRLRGLRAEVAAPGGIALAQHGSTSPALTRSVSSVLGAGSLLDQIVDAGGTATPTDGLSDFVRRAVKPHLIADSTAKQSELLASVDDALAATLRVILHHPDFQALEALWRGIDLLTRRLDTGDMLRLYLADVTRAELTAALENEDDSSRGGLRALLEAGSESARRPRWSVVIANHFLGADDVTVVDRLMRFARDTGVAWVAGAHPSLAGVTSFGDGTDAHDWDPSVSPEWVAIRQRHAAPWLGLALPRFLVRVPYGAATDACEVVPFEEMEADERHDSYLWGNAALLCALLLGESASNGAPWATQGTVDRLPFVTSRVDGDVVAIPCAEAVLSQRSLLHLLSRGLTALVSERGGDAVRVPRLQSIAIPPTPLAIGGSKGGILTELQGAHWAYEPFVLGTPQQFARLREFFARVGFTEAGVCAGAKIGTIYELPLLATRTDAFLDPSDPQTLLVQLLIDGAPIQWTKVRTVLSAADLAALGDLGLLQPSILDPELCSASVSLCPDEQLYVAADKHGNLESVARGVPTDIVYSPLTPETHRFADLMPRVPCNDYLELCSGSGIAALIAARSFAKRAWAVDITERSTRFAEFNAALNGLINVTALEGDLYQPVAGKTFDLITAHPPYVPASKTEMVFRDGGEDGEHITRQIIAGLGQHLRPGGQFYCDCMMTDRVGAPLEDRIREMLGPSASEFDIILGQAGRLEPDEFLVRAMESDQPDFALLEQRREVIDRLKIERFVVATVLIQRRSAPRTVVTRRRMVSSETTAEHYQWYLHWSTATADWTNASTDLLDARPRYAAGTELRSRSVCREGGWKVLDSTLITRTPFALEANCPPWFATLLARCDGTLTAREHLKHLRDIGIIPDAASDAEFAVLIGQLADGGFVELDQFPFQIA